VVLADRCSRVEVHQTYRSDDSVASATPGVSRALWPNLGLPTGEEVRVDAPKAPKGCRVRVRPVGRLVGQQLR